MNPQTFFKNVLKWPTSISCIHFLGRDNLISEYGSNLLRISFIILKYFELFLSRHASKKKMARNQPAHDRSLWQALCRLITWNGEPEKSGRAYYFKEFKKTRPSLWWQPQSWHRRIMHSRNLKKMNALNVPACFKAGLATYKLSGEADYW